MYFFNLSLKLAPHSTYFLLNTAWKFFKYFVCFFYECWLWMISFASSVNVFVFRDDYWRVISRCPGWFFNWSFKFAGMFSLFIPFYTSFSIDESIRSSGSTHLRSITSFLHPYLHPYLSNLFFDIAVMFWTICCNSLTLTILMTRKVVSVYNMVHIVLIV